MWSLLFVAVFIFSDRHIFLRNNIDVGYPEFNTDSTKQIFLLTKTYTLWILTYVSMNTFHSYIKLINLYLGIC